MENDVVTIRETQVIKLRVLTGEDRVLLESSDAGDCIIISLTDRECWLLENALREAAGRLK